MILNQKEDIKVKTMKVTKKGIIFEPGDRLTDSHKKEICQNLNVSKEIDRIIEEGKHDVSKGTLYSVISRISLTDKSVGAINELYSLSQNNKS